MKDKLLKIKNKNTAKCFLINILNGIDIFKSKENNLLFFKKNDIVYFNYHKYGYTLYYSWCKIHLILETKFKLNHIQINDLIKDVMNNFIKLKVNTIISEEGDTTINNNKFLINEIL
jgi:hypothetical protein